MQKPNPNFHTSLGSPMDRALAQHQAALKAANSGAVAVPEAPAMDASGLPFELVALDLTGVDPNVGISTSKAFVYDRPGVGIYYRRRGSHALGALAVNCGGVFQLLYPGDRVQGPFNGFTVAPGVGSTAYGLANLVVEKRRDCRFIESDAPFSQTDTLWSITFAAALNDYTGPAIDVSRYNYLRLENAGLTIGGGATYTTRLYDTSLTGALLGFTTIATMATGTAGVIEWGAGFINAAVLNRAECVVAPYRPLVVTPQVTFSASQAYSGTVRLTGWN